MTRGEEGGGVGGRFVQSVASLASMECQWGHEIGPLSGQILL